MIYIITALSAEARPFIEALQLKKRETCGRFRIYENPDRGITLTITGPGSIPAAAAVGMLLGIHGKDAVISGKTSHERDFLLSFGCCACISENKTLEMDENMQGRNTLCLGNKIINLDSQRTFYPDLLIQTSLPEAEILTGSKVLNSCEDIQRAVGDSTFSGIEKMTDQSSVGMQMKTEGSLSGAHFGANETVLYDMESAAIYEAGSFFLGPHQMSFLRVVTDTGNGAEVTAADVDRCVRGALPELLGYISAVEKVLLPDQKKDSSSLAKSTEGREADTAFETEAEEKLAADLCCSETMRHQLHQLLQYCRAAHIPWKEKTVALYKKGSLPTKDRAKGKKELVHLKEECLNI